MSKKFKLIITNTSSKKRVTYNGITFEPHNTRIFAVSREEKKELMKALKVFPILNVESKLRDWKETNIVDLSEFMIKITKKKKVVEIIEEPLVEIIEEEKEVFEAETNNEKIEDKPFKKKKSKKNKADNK